MISVTKRNDVDLERAWLLCGRKVRLLIDILSKWFNKQRMMRMLSLF